MSKTIFNEINEMGDEKHNLILRIKREEAREERKICHSVLWDIWNKYIEELENEEVEEEQEIEKQEEFFEHFFKNKKGGNNEKE